MAVLSDPIADFLTRVKNAGAARNEVFTAPYSAIKAEIARILQADLRYLFQMPPETGGQLADRKQEDDGVTTPSLPETEKRLLQYFRSLTPEQQTALLEQITLRSIEPLPDEPKFGEE